MRVLLPLEGWQGGQAASNALGRDGRIMAFTAPAGQHIRNISETIVV
jgi:hypothetical protein